MTNLSCMTSSSGHHDQFVSHSGRVRQGMDDELVTRKGDILCHFTPDELVRRLLEGFSGVTLEGLPENPGANAKAAFAGRSAALHWSYAPFAATPGKEKTKRRE